jgi:hypothetical protein
VAAGAAPEGVARAEARVVARVAVGAVAERAEADEVPNLEGRVVARGAVGWLEVH